MKFGAGTFNLERLNLFENKPFRQHKTETHLLIGMPQWSIPSWKGHFYSEDCRNYEFLQQYAKRLPTCEVSSTFYATVNEERWHSWKSQVAADFRFVPKWPQVITHHKKLKDCQQEIKDFIQPLTIINSHLGTTLLQLPPKFSYDYRRELFHFLTSLPQDLPVSIEFRHSSWFQGHRLLPKLEEYLHQHSIGTTCLDTPARQDLCHLSFTGKGNIVRFLSDNNLEHDQSRLKKWRQWIHQHNPGEHLYFMLHRPDNVMTYELINILDPKRANEIEQLNRGPQTDLFL